MLSCKELVRETTAAPSLEDLKRQQRWAIRLHTLMCRHCRRYLRQLTALLKLMPRLHRQADDTTVRSIWRAIESSDTGKPSGGSDPS